MVTRWVDYKIKNLKVKVKRIHKLLLYTEPLGGYVTESMRMHSASNIRPTINFPAKQHCWNSFPIPLRNEGWVGLDRWLHVKSVYSKTVTHLGINQTQHKHYHYTTVPPFFFFFVICWEAKEKERKSIYIAPFSMHAYSKSARTWITSFTCKLHHACLSFVSIHQMVPPLR